MSDRKSSSWFYPNSTGDPGRDRNARTLQFSCFLLAFAVGAVLIVSAIGREWQETPLLVFAIAGFIAAAVMNRAGRSDWAGRTAFLVVLWAQFCWFSRPMTDSAVTRCWFSLGCCSSP